MEQQDRKKVFKFPFNESVKVKILFDEPKTGVSEYGDWWLYGAMIDGKTENFFATETLHRILQSISCRKGTECVITKVAKEGEAGKLITDWKVELLNGKHPEHKAQNTEHKAQNTEHSVEKQLEVPASVWDKKDRRMDAQSAFKSTADIISAMITAGILKTPQEIEEEYQRLAGMVYRSIRDEKFFLKQVEMCLPNRHNEKIDTLLETGNKKQIQTIHILLEKLKGYGWTDEHYRKVLEENYKVTSSTLLTSEQQQKLCKDLSENLNSCLDMEYQVRSVPPDILAETLKTLNLEKKEKYTFEEMCLIKDTSHKIADRKVK